MRKLKLENKAGPSAADALHAAEQRLAGMDAELAGMLEQANRNERELTLAEPEELTPLQNERDLLAKQRAKLERDRVAVESTLPDLRKAAARGEWAVEIAKQEYLRRQFAQCADELVERAHALREAWERIEEIAKENDDLNRRLPGRAIRYGREPLPALLPMFATNLPQVFTEAVATVVERVQTIEVDRVRDPILTNPMRGNMPPAPAIERRPINASMGDQEVSRVVVPNEEPSTRSRWGWFSDLAA